MHILRASFGHYLLIDLLCILYYNIFCIILVFIDGTLYRSLRPLRKNAFCFSVQNAGRCLVLKRFEKRIPLSTPTMHGEEMNFVQEAFDKNWIAPLGFNCDGFEKEMSEHLSKGYDGEEHCLALCSGTAAIHLAVKLAGVKP